MDKRDKAHGKERTWFDMFLEVKFGYENRCFKLEERIRELEDRLAKLESIPSNIIVT